MTQDALITTLDALREFDVWVGGGWGVDALLGRVTRTHDDLDVSIRAEDEAAVLALLSNLGFSIIADLRPVRVALRHDDLGEIDVHPIRFEPDGSAWLPDFHGGRFVYPADSFVEGTLGSHTFGCISAALQLAFHSGYPPQEKDRADMAALAAAGLIELPDRFTV